MRKRASRIGRYLAARSTLLSGITESSIPEQDQIPPALMSASEYAQWLQRNNLS